MLVKPSTGEEEDEAKPMPAKGKAKKGAASKKSSATGPKRTSPRLAVEHW